MAVEIYQLNTWFGDWKLPCIFNIGSWYISYLKSKLLVMSYHDFRMPIKFKGMSIIYGLEGPCIISVVIIPPLL